MQHAAIIAGFPTYYCSVLSATVAHETMS